MKFKMADDKKEEIISEAVRKYPILYDKSDRFFKEKDKKKLAWQDVANVANIANRKSLLSFYLSLMKETRSRKLMMILTIAL